jgi:predicted aldo/keto reductase-like oxidoreductase
MKRRQFLQAAATAAASMIGTPSASAADESHPGETRRGDMLYRPLGRTGEIVSVLGLGGFHVGMQDDEQLSIRIIRTAIDSGVTFMDNCWDYHNGASERRMGKALLDGYRKKVFLMTKIDGRDKKTAAQQIEESLQRLQVDTIDLLQHHEVIRLEDPDRIFAEGGAMEAVMEAKQAGKIRFIGFTGHKDPIVHNRMLDIAAKNGFRFDAVQMPLNVMDAHFRSFEDNVLPRLVDEAIGVLGMKSMAGGAIIKSRIVAPAECLRYAMSLSTSVVISGMDSLDLLKQNLEAVKNFKPLTADQLAELRSRTEQAAATGKLEAFKTTMQFDATSRNPAWLNGT